VSFNASNKGCKHLYNNIPKKHHRSFPICEDDKVYDDLIAKILDNDSLAKIFRDTDEIINRKGTILYHCNNGEHRSASMMVLYLWTRLKDENNAPTLEEIWQWVYSGRNIKPLARDSSKTAMTTIKQVIDNFKKDDQRSTMSRIRR
jgi:hypothetical protein